MSAAKLARLADRGVVRIDGSDAEKLLQGLITNDLDQLGASAHHAALHAGLLSPQGKILFDFFVIRSNDSFLLDVAHSKAGDLAKRLAMYKLRADVRIEDVSPNYAVFALWGESRDSIAKLPNSISFTDPRHPLMGQRLLVNVGTDSAVDLSPNASSAAYDAHRVALAVPQGGKDYEFGDAYPHEAGFDLLNGVSFTKGCFVGQEVVARMQNKTIVRKRIVRVEGDAELVPGSDIVLAEAPIGRLGTVAGRSGLAMLRLDRALEAEQAGQSLTANGMRIAIDPAALALYRDTASPQAATTARP